MPTQEQVNRAEAEIEALQASRYELLSAAAARPYFTDPPGDAPGWESLNEEQRLYVMYSNVLFDGFTVDELDRVMTAAAEGASLEFMEEFVNTPSEALIAERQADEQAARERDYGDVVNPEIGPSFWSPELGDMMRDIAVAPDFDQSARDRIEQAIHEMKQEPEIYLESTRRYVQPDPEDAASIYDTCDTLGPWNTLTNSEKLIALNELEWRGVTPEDKRQIISREAVGVPERDPYDRMLDAAADRAKYQTPDRGGPER